MDVAQQLAGLLASQQLLKLTIRLRQWQPERIPVSSFSRLFTCGRSLWPGMRSVWRFCGSHWVTVLRLSFANGESVFDGIFCWGT
jgi:hypothetical protein